MENPSCSPGPPWAVVQGALGTLSQGIKVLEKGISWLGPGVCPGSLGAATGEQNVMGTDTSAQEMLIFVGFSRIPGEVGGILP